MIETGKLYAAEIRTHVGRKYNPRRKPGMSDNSHDGYTSKLGFEVSSYHDESAWEYDYQYTYSIHVREISMEKWFQVCIDNINASMKLVLDMLNAQAAVRTCKYAKTFASMHPSIDTPYEGQSLRYSHHKLPYSSKEIAKLALWGGQDCYKTIGEVNTIVQHITWQDISNEAERYKAMESFEEFIAPLMDASSSFFLFRVDKNRNAKSPEDFRVTIASGEEVMMASPPNKWDCDARRDNYRSYTLGGIDFANDAILDEQSHEIASELILPHVSEYKRITEKISAEEAAKLENTGGRDVTKDHVSGGHNPFAGLFG